MNKVFTAFTCMHIKHFVEATLISSEAVYLSPLFFFTAFTCMVCDTKGEREVNKGIKKEEDGEMEAKRERWRNGGKERKR